MRKYLETQQRQKGNMVWAGKCLTTYRDGGGELCVCVYTHIQETHMYTCTYTFMINYTKVTAHTWHIIKIGSHRMLFLMFSELLLFIINLLVTEFNLNMQIVGYFLSH